MGITNDFINVAKLVDIGRYCVTQFVKSVAAELPPGTLLLDAGAGECAYKKLFNHCDYKSIDLAVGDSQWNYERVDYIAPLDNMPIEDATFDVVLCTQVLEHLTKPLESVKEMFRVLKPGGYLFLTVPMSQEEHQIPFDFFRYTSYGLKYICSEAGFVDIEVVSFGGMFLRWAYELPRILPDFPKIGIKQGKLNISGVFAFPIKIFLLFFVRLLQAIFVAFDRFDKKKNDPWGWQLVARKQGDHFLKINNSAVITL